jgi:ArsR family transcriptional regulator
MTELLLENDAEQSGHRLGAGAKRELPPGPRLSNALAHDLARIFKLLADETRLRILFLLTQRDEFHVRALCEILGQSQPAVSHHLALLRVAGLIEPRREGKHNFYHVLPERVRQILDRVFTDVPEGSRRLRFEDYVLAFAPPVQVRSESAGRQTELASCETSTT